MSCNMKYKTVATDACRVVGQHLHTGQLQEV